MIFPPDYVGISFDGHSLSAAKLRKRGSHFSLVGTLRCLATSRFLAHDQRRLKYFLSGVRAVTVTLPDDRLLLLPVTLPAIPSNDEVREKVYKQLAEKHDVKLDNFYLGCDILGSAGGSLCLAYAMEQKRFDSVLQLLKNLDLRPCTLTAESFSFFRLLQLENKKLSGNIILLTFPKEKACFSLWRNGRPLQFESLNLGESMKELDKYSLIKWFTGKLEKESLQGPVHSVFTLHQEISQQEDQTKKSTLETPPEYLEIKSMDQKNLPPGAPFKLAIGAAVLASDAQPYMPDLMPESHFQSDRQKRERSWLNRLFVAASVLLLFLAFQYSEETLRVNRAIVIIEKNLHFTKTFMQNQDAFQARMARQRQLKNNRDLPLESVKMLSRLLPATGHVEILHLNKMGRVLVTGHVLSMLDYVSMVGVLNKLVLIKKIVCRPPQVTKEGLVLFEIEMEMIQ